MGNAPSSKDGTGHPSIQDGSNSNKNNPGGHGTGGIGRGGGGGGGGGAPYYGGVPNGNQHYGGYPPVGISPSQQHQSPQKHRVGSDVSMENPSSSNLSLPQTQYNNSTTMPQQSPSDHGKADDMSTDNHNNNAHPNVTPLNMKSAEILSLDDETVPTVFRWEHGGRQVYITGTFNNWSRQIPMHRSGNDFTYIHNLQRGKHAFKFIVDDEWRFAPDQPTVADIDGRINNFIDVSEFRAYTGDRHFEERTESYNKVTSVVNSNNNQSSSNAPSGGVNATGSASATPDSARDVGEKGSGHESNNTISSKGGGAGAKTNNSAGAPPTDGRDDEGFSNTMPDLDEYTKEPPPLPPHLRHIILNKPPQLSDTAALPVPQHVALNHLYCTAIKDNMMVLGITQRFKTKFVTTVYYSPCD